MGLVAHSRGGSVVRELLLAFVRPAVLQVAGAALESKSRLCLAAASCPGLSRIALTSHRVEGWSIRLGFDSMLRRCSQLSSHLAETPTARAAEATGRTLSG